MMRPTGYGSALRARIESTVGRRRPVRPEPVAEEEFDRRSPCAQGPLGWAHIPSHTDLLAPVTPGAAVLLEPSVDLIVVPTSKADPADRNGVRTAVDLAAGGSAKRLLFVCSKAASQPTALAELGAMLDRRLPPQVSAAVTVLDPRSPAVPSFAVDRLPVSSLNRRYSRGLTSSWGYLNDVGVKRNLALLLSARLGLQHVLYLDDDIRPASADESRSVSERHTLDRTSLRAALAAVLGLGGRAEALRAVGWTLRGYDDNSVVCRARILAGRPQGQFIGGGALLVRSPAELPFFPAVYNEDWLFLLGMIENGRRARSVLGWGGAVVQDAYDGYRPRRARSEEPGDIIGEGLMSLVHEGWTADDDGPDHRFWREVVAARRSMIDGLLRDLRPGAERGELEHQLAVKALEAALDVHQQQLNARKAFWIDQFVRFVAAWQSDLDRWRTRLALGSFDTNDDLLTPTSTFLIGSQAAPAFGLGGPGGPGGARRRDLAGGADVGTPPHGLAVPR
jgi:hypothetical protein